jgi:DNA adenine methylase
METSPDDILRIALASAHENIGQSLIQDLEIQSRIWDIAVNSTNRACIRLVMACALAKVHKPFVDIRKPYTEIGGDDVYSGRTYDEQYLSQFIIENSLPCNTTTAFLTPALRNRNTPLSPDEVVQGRPQSLYRKAFQLLDDVYRGKITASVLLTETLQVLLVFKQQKEQRIDTLLQGVKNRSEDDIPLSSEMIVQLIEHHLSRPKASRLPVLVVAAAYNSARFHLQEQIAPLQPHNAADSQTGALGDIEIALLNDDKIATIYEMKLKQVTKLDIDVAIQKIAYSALDIHNYIFITTDAIDPVVYEYATSFYKKTNGIEIAILDCIGFIRHFLHLFHRLRTSFLDEYQDLLLVQPESAVRQELKEVFLALRRDAETALNS